VKGAIPELEKVCPSYIHTHHDKGYLTLIHNTIYNKVFPSKKLDSGESPASKPELNKTEITVEDNIENITNNVLE
jgi:hypothetical protein